MKVVAFQDPLPIEHASSLQDVDLQAPQVSGCDILVDVKAISVNPVDVKVRASRQLKICLKNSQNTRCMQVLGFIC